MDCWGESPLRRRRKRAERLIDRSTYQVPAGARWCPVDGELATLEETSGADIAAELRGLVLRGD
jgi:hypothetical protein